MTRVPAAELDAYDRVASECAQTVIDQYSTSFSLAARLLGSRVRSDVRHVYALVRVADELVDGAAAEAGMAPEQVEALLDALEEQVRQALLAGYSVNLVVHAFARTARASSIGMDLVTPFFASMRADLHRTIHDRASLDEYVYGSAEVVGLMCLRVFLRDRALDEADLAVAVPGAQALGSAFQKINFLRDLEVDVNQLGRTYLEGTDLDGLTERRKRAILDEIDAELAVSLPAIALLPADCRRAVLVAHALFAELAARLRRTAATDLTTSRVRVPNATKLWLAARAVMHAAPARRA